VLDHFYEDIQHDVREDSKPRPDVHNTTGSFCRTSERPPKTRLDIQLLEVVYYISV